jgi:RNA polymerase sigma-70 factor (ECF subfamily)
VARNKRIDAIRRTTKPELDPNDPVLLPSAPPAADQLITGAERDRLVRAAIVDLPEEQRQLLQQAFYDGLSHREIARQLGIAENTVNAQVAIGVLRLRDYLRARGVTKGGQP